MTGTPQSPGSPLGLEAGRGVSAIAAIASGIVVFPTVCFIGLVIAYGHASIGVGNAIFWGTDLVGSAAAGIGVFYSKRAPIWLAAVSGVVVVSGAFAVLTIGLLVAGVI